MSQFANRIRSKEKVLGTFVLSPDPAHTEIVGAAGFDFVVVDMEHAPLDQLNILEHLRAAERFGLTVLVRIGSTDTQQVARLLDAGSHGIAMPHAGLDAQSTSEISRVLRYPPDGTRPACRGVRAANYNLTPFHEYVKRSNESVLSFALVEDEMVIDGIDQLLSDGSWDVVMPGPGDLSTSLGVPGQLEHPLVIAAMDRVVAAAQNAPGVRLGAYVGSPAEVDRWRQRGATVFAYSMDYAIFSSAYARVRHELSALLS